MNYYLAENRYLRFFSFAVYYMAQGLPIGLISIALPAWLVEQGVGAEKIASFVAVSGLPWAFKLIAGPVMDRYSYLAMGRRRPWVVAAQLGILLCMVSMAFVPDPTTNIVLLTAVAFALNCCAAIQDVAVDGMAIDVLPLDERGRANSFMAFGQVAGYSLAGALSASLLIRFGLPGAAIGLALGLGMIFFWGVVVRERKGEKLLPWTEGEAIPRSLALQADNWASIFTNLMKVLFLPASVLLMLITLSWRIAAGFWLVGAPVVAVQQLGYESTDYSYWASTFSAIVAVLGLFLGPFVDRFGSRSILAVAMGGYMLLWFSVWLLVPYWQTSWLPIGVVALEAMFAQLVFISFISIHMSICWVKVSATQFAIYMAWANLTRSIGASLYGSVQPELAQGQEFLIMALVCMVGLGLVFLVRLEDHATRLQRVDQGQVAAA